ncbi:ISAzo13 family transposase [Candidatus Babeliales bacterium]|nr:ISAzo13 family transposase [Candidatus Babeliales bacterium]
MSQLTEQQIATIKDASEKLTGSKRRVFQAQVTLDYLDGKARQAERVFGWSRQTVELGLNELRTGITCVDNFSGRGNRKSEEKQPQLEKDICALAEPESQVDPKFQSPFKYTRMTAKAMRQALIDKKGWKDEDLPCQNTIGNILNRLGYRLRRVQKRKPVKRIRETDAIFENVQKENQKSDERKDSLRISIDAKAKVDLGDFSRRGQLRGKKAPQAYDHDLQKKEKLVPFGILDVVGALLTIIFGTSRETSDFIVDCLQLWWDANKDRYHHIHQLVINLDNGPNNSSFRTQFMKRMVEFAEQNNLEIVLVYYPPYHSKYNPIERCWGILEEHWNGTLLNNADTVLEWAGTMTWKGIQPVVKLWDKIYEKGVRIAKKAFKKIEECFNRHESLPKYCVRI